MCISTCIECVYSVRERESVCMRDKEEGERMRMGHVMCHVLCVVTFI